MPHQTMFLAFFSSQAFLANWKTIGNPAMVPIAVPTISTLWFMHLTKCYNYLSLSDYPKISSRFSVSKSAATSESSTDSSDDDDDNGQKKENKGFEPGTLKRGPVIIDSKAESLELKSESSSESSTESSDDDDNDQIKAMKESLQNVENRLNMLKENEEDEGM